MKTSRRPPLAKDLAAASVALCATAAVSVLSQIATYPNLIWYETLSKPWFNPPNWLFAPVWTSLYLLMAFALWRLLRHRLDTRQRRVAVAAFLVQLFLNAAWSWMFFYARSPFAGLVNIVPQLVSILVTIVLLKRVDQLAAWALIPLACWVSYATLLNASLWWLNG
jgi:tryptophan-rich sensory protein